jgi:eukaryotic-like serine/threonine-protein kinase
MTSADLLDSKDTDLALLLRRLGLDSIDEYHFVRPLGGGGSNITALYQSTKEKAVAKFFFVGPGETWKKRLLNEVTVMHESALLRSALPKVYRTFASEDGFVRGYLMEFVEGKSLGSLIPASGFGDGQTGAAIAYRVLWGYHEGVAPHVMHCDLHPENILFASTMEDWLDRKPDSPEVWILDFGAAFTPLKFGYEESHDPDTWKDFTRRYNGAFYSLAPEFFSSSFYQEAVVHGTFDTWGLGLLLFTVLVGRQLVIADSVGSYVENIRNGELQSAIDRQIDDHCQQYYLNILLKRMLQVDTASRLPISTATAFAAQLYNEDENLIGKRDAALRKYMMLGCDPEAHLPPHERSNSPY